MKRPLIDQQARWMMIHMPDSLIACMCELSLAIRRLGRELLGMYVPYIAWLLPYIGCELKEPYRKYLKK